MILIHEPGQSPSPLTSGASSTLVIGGQNNILRGWGLKKVLFSGFEVKTAFF